MNIHKTATIDPKAHIGSGTEIWVNVQIRENAKIGCNCILSKDVYIDASVEIGDGCKIQNGVSIYRGVTVGDNVFIGPNAVFTNDRIPRAFNSDWEIIHTVIKRGASIGANATIICGIEIGKFSMIAAGSVVTRDVPEFALVAGNPATIRYMIDKNGKRVV